MRPLLGTQQFLQFTKDEIQKYLEDLDRAFGAFSDEHDQFVAAIRANGRQAQQKYFKEIEEIYRAVREVFRKRQEEMLQLQNLNPVMVSPVSPLVENENRAVLNNRERSRSPVIQQSLESVVHRLANTTINCAENTVVRNGPAARRLNPGDLRFRINTQRQQYCRGSERLDILNVCNNCLIPLRGNLNHRCRHGPCRKCGARVFHNSLICPKNTNRN